MITKKMKAKINKIKFPFNNKYKDNCIISINYFGNEINLLVTSRSKDYLGVVNFKVGQEINVVKNKRNGKTEFVITKVF